MDSHIAVMKKNENYKIYVEIYNFVISQMQKIGDFFALALEIMLAKFTQYSFMKNCKLH